MIVSVMTFEYLADEDWLPGALKFTPEILSMLVLLYVVLIGGRDRFQNVRPAYWLAFAAMGLVIACGLVANAIEPGPLFTGIRSYFRALPFFLLPAVYLVTPRQLRWQMVLILGICLIQFPIAYDQRMHDFRSGSTTGDHTTGTLVNSAYLSIFLICAAAVLTAFYVRRRLSLPAYFVLLLVVLAPTTINETKATLLLVPVALMTTFIAGARPGARLRNAAVAIAALAGFGAVFVPVYDHFVTPRWGYGILDFLTMEGRVEGYLSDDAGLGAEKAGRLDALTVPARELTQDPGAMAFGYGLGNASDSALGMQFQGRYFRKFSVFLKTTASTMMLEVGFLGLGLALLVLALVLGDSRRVVARDESFMGAFALGWIGVTVTIVCSLFYKPILDSTAIAYLFTYFSGIVAAHRMRLANQNRPSERELAAPRFGVERQSGLL